MRVRVGMGAGQIFLTRVGEVEEVTRNFEGALGVYNRSLELLEGLDQPIAKQQLHARLGAIHTELAQFSQEVSSTLNSSSHWGSVVVFSISWIGMCCLILCIKLDAF